MRRFLSVGSLLLVLVLFGGCASDSDSPTLYVGMSRDRLKSRFGEPLRVERTTTGEDWYYSFASWNPSMDGSVDNDGTTRTTSVSMTLSDDKSARECPVHLSPDGYVVEPLPAGKIVGR